MPVGSQGHSLFLGRPPTSGGFGYGGGANFQHGGGGSTWVGGSTLNGGTIGIGGSSGDGGFEWGAGYSPSGRQFTGRLILRFKRGVS